MIMTTKKLVKKNSTDLDKGMYTVFTTDEGFFAVELGSLQSLTLAKFNSMKSAKELVKKLNSGQGFAGFTPPFMSIPSPKLM